MLQTGLLNKVRCIICGREVKDWMSLQFVILLLCKYRNRSSVMPANVLAGGKLLILLSLKSIFFSYVKF